MFQKQSWCLSWMWDHFCSRKARGSGGWEKKRRKKEKGKMKERTARFKLVFPISFDPSTLPPLDPPNIEQHRLPKSLSFSGIKLVRIHMGYTSSIKMLKNVRRRIRTYLHSWQQLEYWHVLHVNFDHWLWCLPVCRSHYWSWLVCEKCGQIHLYPSHWTSSRRNVSHWHVIDMDWK